MLIDVLEANKSDISVIDNLARFYVYDISEYTGWACPENGLFGCGDEEFWNSERNHFFLIRVDGELAGFAVTTDLQDHDDADYDMEEFFILRKFRGKGIGQKVAYTLFDRFRGKWTVRQLLDNLPASLFWRKIISQYTIDDYRESIEFIDKYGIEMIVQRFNNAK